MKVRASIQAGIDKSLEEIRALLNRSIQLNFQQGGRPDAWKKSMRGGATLMDTGRLSRAVLVEYRKSSNGRIRFEARTQNIIYAAIHQFGGTIRPVNAKSLAIPVTPEARKVHPRDFKGLFPVRKQGKDQGVLCTQDGKGKIKVQYLLRKSVYIPMRKYAVVQTNDWEDIRTILLKNAKTVAAYEIA